MYAMPPGSTVGAAQMFMALSSQVPKITYFRLTRWSMIGQTMRMRPMVDTA